MDWLLTSLSMATVALSGVGLVHARKLRREAEHYRDLARKIIDAANERLELAKDKEQRALRLHERALAAEANAASLRAKPQLVSVPTPIGSVPIKRRFDPISTSHAATTPHRRRSDTDSDWPTVEQCSHDDAPAFKSDPVVPELRADPEPIKSGGEYSGAGASSSWVDSSSDSSSSSSSSSGD